MLEHCNDNYTIGVDEVGRGCLFGSGVAAAITLPLHLEECDIKMWNMIKDSKKLSEKKRFMLRDFLHHKAITKYNMHSFQIHCKT